MRPAWGFYATQGDTFFVDCVGAIWHVGTFFPSSGEPLPQRVEALPKEAKTLHNSVVEEAIWERVSNHPHVIWSGEPPRSRRGRSGGREGLELSHEVAKGFWDWLGDDEALG